MIGPSTPTLILQAEDYSWAEEFHAFTLFHYLLLAICLASFVIFSIVGKRLLTHDLESGTHYERTFRHVLAWSIILSQAFFFIRRLTPSHWDIQDSLPMHLCRWMVWIAAWALLTHNRRMRAFLLFGGIGLSTQAFFSPMITYGMGSMGFWIYWINHTQIVGAAIYDLSVLGYRPTRKDLHIAIIWGTAYAIFTIAINLLLNTNYSYLGRGAHQQSSIVDQLGPFPGRVVWMILGAWLIFGFIYIVSKLMFIIRTRVLKLDPPLMIGQLDSDSHQNH